MKPFLLQLFASWYVFASFLLGLQIYLMSRAWFLLPLILLLPYLTHKFSQKCMQAQINEKRWVILFTHALAGVHFLPLLLQLIGVGTPRFDTLLVASFGLLLFYANS